MPLAVERELAYGENEIWQLSLFYGTYAVKLAGSSGLVETSWVQPLGGCPAVGRRGSEWFSG